MKSMEGIRKMAEPRKCWRCLEKPWARSPQDNQDMHKIITCKPHDCEGLEIKIRVPVNICSGCAYALKLRLETDARVFRTKARIEKEINHGEE